MKKRALFLAFAAFTLLGCTNTKENVKETAAKSLGTTSSSSASWAYSNMVVLNKRVYAGTSEAVDKVGAKIGSILVYSDHEAEAQTNFFSNQYPKGTNLYLIPGIPEKEAIAIEMDKNKFIKANKVSELQ